MYSAANGFIVLVYTRDKGKLLLAVTDTATGSGTASGLVLGVTPDIKVFRDATAGTGCETANVLTIDPNIEVCLF